MIRILFRDGQGDLHTDLQVDDLDQVLKDPTALVWIDMAAEPKEKVEPVLKETFKFHPLAIDDALQESHVPKVDDWQEYLCIVLSAVDHMRPTSDRLKVSEIDLFIGANFFVTYHTEKVDVVDRVWEVSQKDQRRMQRGAGHLLYRLADEIASEAIATVEEMQDELQLIESQLFDQSSPAMLERLLTLKRNILLLRRIVVPQRDVLHKLVWNEFQIVNSADQIFYRDVYDHMVLLHNLLDDLVILTSGARDTYLSVVNNQMNVIMKTLTVITAFFMPLAFMTGFFGMNFFQAQPPYGGWTSAAVFAIVLLSMALIPASMFMWMRYRAWI